MKKLIPIFNLFSDIFYRSSLNKVSRQQSLQKLGQLQKSIANWEGPDIASNSSELVHGKIFIAFVFRALIHKHLYNFTLLES